MLYIYYRHFIHTYIFYTHGKMDEANVIKMLTLGYLEMKNLGEGGTRFFVLFLQLFYKSGIMSE